MYFKSKIINGKKYKYAAKSIRLPDGRVRTLEKLYKGGSKIELEKFFEEREKREFVNYALRKYACDHIFTREEIEKLELINYNYRKIIKKISKISLRDLFDRFTANFTYESNALEGNSLTLKDVVMVMFENIAIKGKDLREIYETRNSRIVVEGIFKNKFSISHKDIIKMHKILVRDTEIHEGYKKFPNVIIGRKMRTTPPENVEQEMNNLILWYIKNRDKLHPLKLASRFHGVFEQIHPFEDGNGRVGRFLINVILIENKYFPLIIRKSQRVSYLTALEKFDLKHYDTLERFLLERFKETYRKFFEVYVKYI